MEDEEEKDSSMDEFDQILKKRVQSGAKAAEADSRDAVELESV